MRLRLFLAFTIIVLVTLTGLSLMVRVSTENQVKDFWARGGPIGAHDLVTTLETYFETNESWVGVETILEPGWQTGSGQGQGQGQGNRGQGGRAQGATWHYLLLDEDGRVVYDTQGLETGKQYSADVFKSGISIQIDRETAGYIIPEAGVGIPGTEFEEDLIAQVNKAAVQMAVISGTLSLILSLIFAALLIRPIKSLQSAAQQMASGDLSQRVQINGNDEMADLGEAFNHMAASLEHAEETRQAMTADIAHELRTPLAVQRANLEAMLDDIYPLDKDNLQRLLSQNHLLVRLVEDLRTLALVDAGELHLQKRETDLVTLIRQIAERFSAQFEERGMQLSLGVPESEKKQYLDPERVEQIMTNLLQNALRYGKEGGQTRISLSFGEDTRISVHDNGPGIPDEEQEKIFDRFYRADKSRARDEGGTGLGLAIARQLARAHGGDLIAANHPQGGAVFTLVL